jgi:cyclic pyranopterin phosphate synthase
MIADQLMSLPVLGRREELSVPVTNWHDCRLLTCSVLPVRMACNLRCPFCFSKSSISALRHERTDWRSLDLSGYFRFAIARGATRLVITGGGEPLLRPDDVVYLVQLGRRYFEEIACFTNGTYLTADLARRFADAGW